MSVLELILFTVFIGTCSLVHYYGVVTPMKKEATLDMAALKDLSIHEESRRPRLYLLHDIMDVHGAADPNIQGIDIADIAEVRPGVRATNFDAAKAREDVLTRQREAAVLRLQRSARLLSARRQAKDRALLAQARGKHSRSTRW